MGIVSLQNVLVLRYEGLTPEIVQILIITVALFS